MLSKIDHVICGIACELYGDGTIYVPSLETLFIADVHIGKTGQFRKEGIPAPKAAHHHGLQKLQAAISRAPVREVVFLGDLFEGKQNSETEDLSAVFRSFPHICFRLVKGNHDFDVPDWAHLEVHQEYRVGPFICLHEPPGNDFNKDLPFDRSMVEANYPGIGTHSILLCGHLHPGAVLKGKGRSRLRIKTFFIGDVIAVLPAFGALTGQYPLEENGQYFGIIENSILNLGSWPK